MVWVDSNSDLEQELLQVGKYMSELLCAILPFVTVD